MSPELLTYINDVLTQNGINYEFMRWTTDIVYPYFVGEFIEPEPQSEDGGHDVTFLLTGHTRGSYLELIEVKDKIENLFDQTKAILPNGNGVAFLYGGSTPVPTLDAELKRIEINLIIKGWKVK